MQNKRHYQIIFCVFAPEVLVLVALTASKRNPGSDPGRERDPDRQGTVHRPGKPSGVGKGADDAGGGGPVPAVQAGVCR